MSFAGIVLAVSMLFQDVDDTGTAVSKPVGEAFLEPTTGSYFQVFEFYGRPPHTWIHADRMVRGYYYEGREGRLARVLSGNVHYFLLVKFPLLRQMQTWIGLKVVCKETAEIGWIDGPSLEEQAFRAWNDGTQKKISRTCRESKDTGRELHVYYDPHELGTRWEVADNASVNLRYMLVEFRKPTEEAEQVENEPVTDSAKPSENQLPN